MKHKLMRRLTALTVMVAASLAVSGSALADTFAVTNKNDAGPGSLRSAITRANTVAGADVVSFAPNVEGHIVLKTALPSLRGQLEIQGPGAGDLVVRRSSAPGTKNFRVFTVADDAIVTISGLKVSNGRQQVGAGIGNGGTLTLEEINLFGNTSGYAGGGIYNDGVLLVEESTVSGNKAGVGGGIHNSRPTRDDDPITAQVVVRNSTFSENKAGYGGGIYNLQGNITVEGSTFSKNAATDEGGGINNRYAGQGTVRNSTFTGNTAGNGGGIYNTRRLTVEGTTITGNSATGVGGGVYYGGFPAQDESFVLRRDILAGNEAPAGPDAYSSTSNSPEDGDFTSGGYNLIGDTSRANGFGPTDLQNVDARLDPEGLKDNGGPTQTIALLPDSPAVDAATEGCPPLATDQRGVSRPQDGDGDGVALCDIGAYELLVP